MVKIMTTVKEVFGMRDTPMSVFVNPARQSVEQVEDYAVKKVVATRELIVDGVNISQHSPTNYMGSDFAGVNPNKTLTHSRTLSNSVMLVIGGRVMHRTLEYTIAGSVITMVNVYIGDSDYVMVVD